MRSRRGVQSVVIAVLTIGIALGAVMPVFAQAGGRPGWHGSFGGPLLPLFLRAANLTPDQKASVRTIVAAHRPTTMALRQQLGQLQQQLADALLAPGDVQTATVQALVQQIAQVRTQLFQESTQVALEIRALLTPDQLARANLVKDRMRDLRSQMRQLWQQQNP